MRNPSFVSRSLLFSRGTGLLTALLGATVLVGWWLDIAALKSAFPGTVSMKANTAATLVAAGTALLLNAGPGGGWTRRVAKGLAVLVLLVAVLNLGQYLGAVDLGIDEWLFRDDMPLATSHPGRMAPITATGLSLIGLAMLLSGRSPRAAQRLNLVVATLALLSLVGYAFGVQALYRLSSHTSIAVHTALALLLLSLGGIAAQPAQGFMAIVVSDSSAGFMARRLLPLVPLLILGLGWLTLLGQRTGLYDQEFGLALAVLSGVAATTILVLRLARRIHRVDLQHEQAQAQLAALNARLEQTVAARTQELNIVNARLMAENLERQRAEQEVRRLSLTDELTGLWNRRGFLVLAEQALRSARRANQGSALFYMDLDGLKRVNDANGHEAGDAMLRDVALVLTTTFRASDIVSRLGGDEFVVLAANTAQGGRILDRLQQALDQLNQGRPLMRQLSLSVGQVDCAPAEDKTLTQLLAEADALMYAQKQRRRLRGHAEPDRNDNPRTGSGQEMAPTA